MMEDKAINAEAVKENKEYMVFGKPTVFNGNINIAHPIIDEPDVAGQKKILAHYAIL